MSLRLSGINPLSYMGVEPYTPPALLIKGFPPTPNDFQNINLGTLWLVYPNSVQTLWMLISVAGGTATWVQLYPAGGGGAGASEFPTDAGTANELAGVLNILGDTRVTTSGAGHTVTVHLSGAVASEFDTNAGTAVPSGGLLNILGGTNINTSGSGDTVTVNLDNSVTLSGNLSVGGTVTVTDFSSGVVTSGITGLLDSTNGTNGQVLIGGGIEPAWANITSTGNTVTITNGANSINLESTGGGGPSGSVCFACYQPSDVGVPAIADPAVNSFAPYVFGTLAAMTVTANEGAAFYPGDGVGGQAIFTAPVNGNYYFELRALLSRGSGTGGTFSLQSGQVYAQILSPTLIYSYTDGNGTAAIFWINQMYVVSATIPLTTGQQITFRMLGPAGNVGIPNPAYFVDGPFSPTGRGPFNQLNYMTTIQGFLI